jgi:hypothetical protein
MWFLMPLAQREDVGCQEQVRVLAEEMVEDAKEVVGGVWDGGRAAMAMNVGRFFGGRREEVVKWGRFRERDEALGRGGEAVGRNGAGDKALKRNEA